MDNLGSEVGQKMRCAVKAKLIELGSGGGYIDDELPDYVMIMVANKRSKQQMISDLNLFLGENTELFVTWLYEVLQKLQEVTLPPNPVVRKETKRKASGSEDKSISKRDKKEHKKEKKNKKSSEKAEERTTPPPAITDVFADHLLEKAKSTLPIDTSIVKKREKPVSHSMKSHSSKSNSENNTPNEFDIPTITEIQENNNANNVSKKREQDLAELAEIQKKIYQAKRQLKNFDELDESEDEDFLNLKEDGDEFDDFENKETHPNMNLNKNKKRKSPVVFERDTENESDIKNKTANNKDNKKREPIIYLPPQRRNEREIEISLNRKIQDNKIIQKPVEKDNNREEILKRKSVHERLGLRIQKSFDNSSKLSSSQPDIENLQNKIKISKEREVENHSPNRASSSMERGRLVSRVIVAASKHTSNSENEEEDDKPLNSIIKIKPRPNVSPRRQACKNLLLRAVAEAQRSTILRSDAKIRRKSSSPDNKRNHKLYSKSFRDRNRNDVIKRNKSNIVIEVNSKFVSNDKRRHQSSERDGEEYVPEPISDRGDSDNNDYVYVPRTINNEFGDEDDDIYFDKYENDVEIDSSNTQFVVTMNEKNDKYGKKYSTKINEPSLKLPQSAKFKDPKNKPVSEKGTNTDKPDRLQLLAKKIKDKKLAERNNAERHGLVTNKNSKEIKRRHANTREVGENDFDKSLTPPLEDFIAGENTENKRSPPKRKRISITPTNKIDDLDDNHEKSLKSNEEGRKVSTKKMEIVKKYEKIPELSAVPIKNALKPKPKERCKFFPLCSNGDCEFFHPSALCKSFPNCKYFADKCLFIHPKCKFDLACQRNDCNFTHSIVMSAPQVAPPLSSHVVPVQNYKTITTTPLPTMCKYYPNCSNTNCTFYHPKLCRFGKNCLNKIECNFYHHEIPNLKDKFKWVASNA
ncbi:zinc finger CCCH domain-containing protein 14 [Condylostylus longicornis]|uniref:zinc finger CCCH domain-containing protein 14 n=1 Tax=Condylostylus longicornis TaxID=2530218 RepID=UPI00244E2A31|nr:zinc finger CCCH domain-containing protein 14 [Condylostylus longicornis]